MIQRVLTTSKYLLVQSKVMVGALGEGMLVTLWKIRKKKKTQCYRGFEMAIFYCMAPDRVAKAGMTLRGRHSTPKSL